MRFKKSMSYQAKIILSVLVKLGLFQYSFLIYSIHQAVKEIEINIAKAISYQKQFKEAINEAKLLKVNAPFAYSIYQRGFERKMVSQI